MALTSSFMDAVQSGDTMMVRIMMKDSLVRDPSGREFDEMDRTARGLGGLYVPHEGAMNTDPSAWNEDYMNAQMVELVSNFSKDRVAHLKQVCRAIYKDVVEAKAKPRPAPVYLDRREEANNSAPFVWAALMVGAAVIVLLIAWWILSH